MRWTQAEYDAWDAKVRPAREKTDRQEADPGPESVLQNKIKKWANDNGYPILSFPRTPKVRSFLPAGWPDCSLILKDKLLFLELKAGKGRLSLDQVHMKLKFMALGHEIHEVKSYKRFLEIIRE